MPCLATRRLLLVLLLLLLGCFPKQPGPRLQHFAERAPQIGDPAPNFELLSLDGGVVELAALLGEKPIVVQLGSHSCPVYRYRSRHWMRDLVAEYQDRVHFLLVYTLEAHPRGAVSPYSEKEWLTSWNRFTGVKVPQPTTEHQRQDNAVRSRARLEIDWPVLVDSMDNTVWQTYGAASSPAFVIDKAGRIVARQVWIQPAEIRRVLDSLLDSPLDSPPDGP